jgi:hypothetical protein
VLSAIEAQVRNVVRSRLDRQEEGTMLHRTFVYRLLAILALALAPVPASAVEKQITDVREIAGTWEGWATSQLGAQTRIQMTIKPDGTYESSTIPPGGTLTRGTYYLDGGRLRYRSSRTQGTATVSQDDGKTRLTMTPEGTVHYATGPATFERVN